MVQTNRPPYALNHGIFAARHTRFNGILRLWPQRRHDTINLFEYRFTKAYSTLLTNKENQNRNHRYKRKYKYLLVTFC